MLTLAHLSDVHLAPLPRLPLAHANVKRALGFLNWHRKRHAVHRPEVVAALLADLTMQNVDHIAVTGDLVNIGLPEEYTAAQAWLERLGSPRDVSVVPGNHDIYTRLVGDPGVERWRGYMDSDDWGRTLTSSWVGFPYARRIRNVALIGLCSAIPTPPFVAGGRLGPEQLARLPGLLDACRRDGLIRVVLIHHPPFPGQASRLRGLFDTKALQGVIAQHGAELILHGHNHVNMLARSEWPGGSVIALGVPSFSAGKAHHGESLGRYNLIRFLPESETGLGIELIGRGLSGSGLEVVEVERRRLDTSAGAATAFTKN